jgi:hypothetical protein
MIWEVLREREMRPRLFGRNGVYWSLVFAVWAVLGVLWMIGVME